MLVDSPCDRELERLATDWIQIVHLRDISEFEYLCRTLIYNNTVSRVTIQSSLPNSP